MLLAKKNQVEGEMTTIIDIGVQVGRSCPFLGRVAATTNHLYEPPFAIDPESPYGRLPREPTDTLSGPDAETFVFEDDAVKERFESLYKGENLVVGWTFQFAAEHQCLISDAKPLLVMHIMERAPDGKLSKVAFVKAEATPKHKLQYGIEGEEDDNLLVLLRHQQKLLIFRIIHLFLRVAGSDIGPNSFAVLYRLLMDAYVAHEWWKLALDLHIIMADIMLHWQPTTLFEYVEDLSVALQACGMTSQAPDVMGQFADFLAEKLRIAHGVPLATMASSALEVTRMRNKQAKLYLDLKRWEKSETVLLNALREIFCTMDAELSFSTDEIQNLLHSLDDVYLARLAENHRSSSATELVRRHERNCCLLHAMIHACGLGAPSDDEARRQLDQLAKEHLRRDLHESTSVAKKSFLEALKLPCEASFLKAVKSWKRPNHSDITMPKEFLSQFQTPLLSKKEMKAKARSTMTSKFYIRLCCRKLCDRLDNSDVQVCGRCQAVWYWYVPSQQAVRHCLITCI